MSTDTLNAGLATLALSRKCLLQFAAAVPPDKLCHQPYAGANHVLWNMGHIAWADDHFREKLSGAACALPPGFAECFGLKSSPVGDASHYPSLDVVHEQLAARRQDLLTWLRSLTPAQLASPLPSDFANFAPSHAAFPAAVAWHEGIHIGQIVAMRKSLGLEPVIG